MECTRSGQAQTELSDDLWNDDADRIRRHSKHHEHQKRQPADEGNVLVPGIAHSKRPPASSRSCFGPYFTRTSISKAPAVKVFRAFVAAIYDILQSIAS